MSKRGEVIAQGALWMEVREGGDVTLRVVADQGTEAEGYLQMIVELWTAVATQGRGAERAWAVGDDAASAALAERLVRRGEGRSGP